MCVYVVCVSCVFVFYCPRTERDREIYNEEFTFMIKETDIFLYLPSVGWRLRKAGGVISFQVQRSESK